MSATRPSTRRSGPPRGGPGPSAPGRRSGGPRSAPIPGRRISTPLRRASPGRGPGSGRSGRINGRRISSSSCRSSLHALDYLLDLAADRCHPRKRLRPFASGEVPPAGGLALAALLALAFLATPVAVVAVNQAASIASVALVHALGTRCAGPRAGVGSARLLALWPLTIQFVTTLRPDAASSGARSGPCGLACLPST